MTQYSQYSNVVSATTDAGYPVILEDGNTKGWYLADNLDTITKDGSDRVSVWADFLASGHDLIQATDIKQPLYTGSGILFCGGVPRTEVLKATFPWVQPAKYYIVFKVVSWTNVDFIFDGNVASTTLLYQSAITPGLKAYAGTASSQNNNLAVDTLGLVKVLFNGALSKFQINETAVIEWNAGNNDPAGFTLGAQGNQASNPSNIEVAEIIPVSYTHLTLPTKA